MAKGTTVLKIGSGIALFSVLYFLFNKEPDFEDTPLPEGSNVDTQKTITMSSALYEVLTNIQWSYFSNERCTLFGSYLQYNDADFINTANVYKNKFGVTLRSSIADLIVESCYIYETDNEQLVLDRMTRLNIP